jgi:hypothetical protein
MGPLIFRAITKAAVALPLAALLVLGYAWWGHAALQLARQIDGHRPETAHLDEAAETARDRDLYVRLSDAQLDCGKELSGDFGDAFALADGEGSIPAMAHLAACDPTKAAQLEGVFREPPYGLYGEAFAAGWKITPGHLAYFDTIAHSSDPWRRVGISALGSLLLLASALSIVAATRTQRHRRAWRLRGVGLWLLSLMPWLAYQAHDEVVFGALPVPALAAIGAAVCLAMVLAPNSSVIDTLADRWGLDED